MHSKLGARVKLHSKAQKIRKVSGNASGLDLPEQKDVTGAFPKRISWKTKLATLRLAKEDAWHNGATRFSEHLFKWERDVGLRVPAHTQNEGGGKPKEILMKKKDRLGDKVTKKRSRS